MLSWVQCVKYSSQRNRTLAANVSILGILGHLRNICNGRSIVKLSVNIITLPPRAVF